MKRMMLSILFLLVLSLSCCSLAEKEKLYITQTGAASMQEKQYIEENPDIDITIRRVDDCTPGWVAQQIESGDNITDLYVVRTNYAGYYDLISRGYCAELNSIEQLSSILQKMPQYVLDAISCNGTIFAVPEMIILNSDNCVLCNTKHPLWQQYDLKNHHSVKDILDMIDDLQNKNELDQWWLWDDHCDDAHLYNISIVGCISYMEANDHMDMSNPEYVNLFYQQDKARQRLIERSTPPENEALFHSLSFVDSSLLTNEDYELIIFTPFPGQTEMFQLSMQVIVLNPYAPNKEDAIAYLMHRIENYPQLESLFLFPDTTESQVTISDEITEVNPALTQDVITKVRSSADVIRIPTKGYLTLFWDEPGLSAESRYFSGYMSIEQYIEYLTKKLRMIESESK